MAVATTQKLLTPQESFFNKLDTAQSKVYYDVHEAWVKLTMSAGHVSPQQFTSLVSHFLSVTSKLFAHLSEEYDLDKLSHLITYLNFSANVNVETGQQLLAIAYGFAEYQLFPQQRHYDIFHKFKSPKVKNKFQRLQSSLPIILKSGIRIEGCNDFFDHHNVDDSSCYSNTELAEYFLDQFINEESSNDANLEHPMKACPPSGVLMQISSTKQKLLLKRLEPFRHEDSLIALLTKLMKQICLIVAKNPTKSFGHDQHNALNLLLIKANKLLFKRDHTSIDRLVTLCRALERLDKGHPDLIQIRVFLQQEIFPQHPSLTPTHLAELSFRQSLAYHHIRAHSISSSTSSHALELKRDRIPYAITKDHLTSQLKKASLIEKIVNWFLTCIHRQQFNKKLNENGFFIKTENNTMVLNNTNKKSDRDITDGIMAS